VPDFLDAVQAMESELGSEPNDDWNAVWEEGQRIAEEHDARWTAASKKLFRQCFATVDPEAQPVIAKTFATRRVSFEVALFGRFLYGHLVFWRDRCVEQAFQFCDAAGSF
jgi:hypothetical protein